MNIANALNPKGQVVTEQAAVVRRAIWLSRLCTLWLQFCGDDIRVARARAPGLGLSKEMNKARDESGYFATGTFYRSRGKMLKDGWKQYPAEPAKPRPQDLVAWPLVFDHWESGALDRGIRDLMLLLPTETRAKLERTLQDD